MTTGACPLSFRAEMRCAVRFGGTEHTRAETKKIS